MDQQLVEQVWQRVRASGPDRMQLHSLEAQARETAWACRFLAARAGGQRSRLLLQAARLKLEQSACLRGLGVVTGERFSGQRRPTPDRRRLLEDCCARDLQCLESYTAQCTQSPFGQVYAQLLKGQRQVCQILLMLLGKR